MPTGSYTVPGNRTFRDALAHILAWVLSIERGKTGTTRLRKALNSSKYLLVGARFYAVNVREALAKGAKGAMSSRADGDDEVSGEEDGEAEEGEAANNEADLSEAGDGDETRPLPSRTAHVYFCWSTGAGAQSWGQEKTRYFETQEQAWSAALAYSRSMYPKENSLATLEQRLQDKVDGTTNWTKTPTVLVDQSLPGIRVYAFGTSPLSTSRTSREASA